MTSADAIASSDPIAASTPRPRRTHRRFTRREAAMVKAALALDVPVSWIAHVFGTHERNVTNIRDGVYFRDIPADISVFVVASGAADRPVWDRLMYACPSSIFQPGGLIALNPEPEPEPDPDPSRASAAGRTVAAVLVGAILIALAAITADQSTSAAFWGFLQ